LISFIIAFFPIVIQTALGLKSVENDELDLIRIMSPSAFQVFTKIRIPNALPHFFGGLKVAVTLSLIGAIVGEFIGSDRGLGYLLQYANTELDTELLFATLVLLMVLGGVLFLAVIRLEKWLLPWHVAIREEPQKGVRVSEGPAESTA
jgi:NitT/TauT family transport system permease protein